MSDAQGDRYNLVFAGQILPGTSRENALQALAAFFGVADPAAMAPFFAGRPVPLRRNLSKADAIRIYRDLRDSGLLCDLVAVTEVAPAPKKNADPEPEPEPEPETPAIASGSWAQLGPSGPGPNYFALRPALATLNYPQLRAGATARAMLGLGVAVTILVICAGLLLRFPARDSNGATGPEAAAEVRGQLLILADNALHLHGRSGRGIATIEAAEFGFDRISSPLWWQSDGQVVLNALRDGSGALQLWRCVIETRECGQLMDPSPPATVTALTGNSVNDVLVVLLADGALLRVNPRTGIEAENTLEEYPDLPRLMSAGGLLYLPSPQGPLLGVFRPDTEGFGEQLDALLLMPPLAVAGEHNRILDAVAVTDGYWVLLAGDNVPPLLQRYDRQWNPDIGIEVAASSDAAYLVAWQDKVLIADPQKRSLQRVSSAGVLEAPLHSKLLEERWNTSESALQFSYRSRTLATAAASLLGTAALAFALLQTLLSRRLPQSRQRGSAILDPMPGGIHWLPAPAQREPQLRRILSIILLLPVLAALLLRDWHGATSALTLIPAVVASVIAARLEWRSRGGYCGLLPEHVIVVDYDGRYCFARRQDLRGRYGVLCLGEVILPLHGWGFINMESGQLQETGGPLHIAKPMHTGELAARLVQQKHPVAMAILWLGGGWLCSVLLILITLLIT